MLPKSVLRILVFSIPVLIVAFAVLMGGYALAQGVGDALGARVLLWIALSLLILLLVDLLLLVSVLGLLALGNEEENTGE